MDANQSPPPPPAKSPKAVAAAPLPKKKPWSKPTIRVCDGELEIVESGMTVTGNEKDVQYSITS